MSEQIPPSKGYQPDYITEEEFFLEGDIEWGRTGISREAAAESFTDKVNELLDNNPPSRFIYITRVDDRSYTKPIEDMWERVKEAQQSQDLTEDEIEQRVAFFREGLKAVMRQSVTPPTPSYSEHVYATASHGYYNYLIDRTMHGGEISSWDIPKDTSLWTPPEAGSLRTTYSVIRYKTTDEKGRKVPVVRQHKDFFDRKDDGLVYDSEMLQSPNPDDYGRNAVAKKIWEQDFDFVANHPGRKPAIASHFRVMGLIRGLTEASVQTPSLGLPTPILQHTLVHRPTHPTDPYLPPNTPKPSGKPQQSLDSQFSVRAVGF